MNGNQSVTLTWAAQNAIGFALTGGGVNEPSLPYDQRSYAVISLPLSSPSTFTLVAAGFDGSGAYTPIYKTITVDPSRPRSSSQPRRFRRRCPIPRWARRWRPLNGRR
jgi:hypothetical protein